MTTLDLQAELRRVIATLDGRGLRPHAVILRPEDLPRATTLNADLFRPPNPARYLGVLLDTDPAIPEGALMVVPAEHGDAYADFRRRHPPMLAANLAGLAAMKLAEEQSRRFT